MKFLIDTRGGEIAVELKRFKSTYTFKAGTTEEFQNSSLDKVLKYIWPDAHGEYVRDRDKAELSILKAEKAGYRMQYSVLSNPESLADRLNKADELGVKVMDIEVPCQGRGCDETVATTCSEFTPIHEAAYDAFEDNMGCGEEFLCECCSRVSNQQDYDEARAEDAAEAARELASESVTFNVA